MHFPLFAISSSLLLAQSALSHPLSTLLTRTSKSASVLLPNWNSIASAYAAAVSPAHVTKRNTWTETIPDACYKQATAKINATEPSLNRPFCPSIKDLEVFELWFSDAPTPWLFCRCKDSKFSEETMREQVGRIPAAVRQKTRYIMSFKDGPQGVGGWATSERDIVMFGTPGQTTWLHEMGHQFDAKRVYSSSDVYKNAIAKDTCWSTAYAKKVNQNSPTYTEPWAETFIIQRLYKISPKTMPVNIDCLKQQVLAVGTQVDGIINAGYQQKNKIPYGPATYKRSKLEKRDAEEELEGGIDVVFATPSDWESGGAEVGLEKREAKPEEESVIPEFITPVDFD